MKKLLTLLTVVTLLNFTGCNSIEKYNSLPDSEKAAFIRDQAKSWLVNNKDTVKDALVLAGIEILHRATSDEEREEITNQMWAASVAFNSLATGKKVSSADVTTILRQFSKGTKAVSYSKYIAQATQLWSAVYSKLNLSEDQQLVIDYLVVFSSACQTVAEANR